MTISNSNLSSVLGINPGTPADGMIAVQMPAENNLNLTSGESLDEGEFWSMLSQQLMGIAEQSDTQVIENEDLLALFTDFEQVLEGSEGNQQVAAQWMQVLKSHFASEDVSMNADQDMAEADDQMLAAALLLTEKQVITDGEALPPGRQALTAGLTVDINARTRQEPALLLNQSSAPDTDEQGVADELLKLDGSGKQVTVMSQEEMATLPGTDKLLRQQAASESTLAPLKDNAFTIQGLQGPSAALSGQHTLQQSVSSSLHTLSLSPQSSSSEWGHALGERVTFLINQKMNSAEIRIDPPHLGKLDIQIQVKDDAATIIINTQHAQTRDLIDSASLRLREFLQDAGYSTVDVNVSHREQGHGEQDLNQQADYDTGDDSQGSPSSGSDSTNDLMTMQAQLTVDDGRIDYFA